jgi:hypothetical protein
MQFNSRFKGCQRNGGGEKDDTPKRIWLEVWQSREA